MPATVRDDPSRGIIASYAWGDDYHELIRPRLYELDAFIRTQTGRNTVGKCLVDTGPVLERDWAQQAGIGFMGKNCCTIASQSGSWLLLASLIIPEELSYDPAPLAVDAHFVSVDDIIKGLPADENYGSWSIPLQEGYEQSKIQNRPTEDFGGLSLSKATELVEVFGELSRAVRAAHERPKSKIEHVIGIALTAGWL